MRVRYSTYEDVVKFYGEARTQKSIVAEDDDGNIICVAGVTLADAQAVVFMDIDPDTREDIQSFAIRRLFVKGLPMVKKLADSFNAPLVAYQDCNFDRAKEYLERIGMTFNERKGMYEWIR